MKTLISSALALAIIVATISAQDPAPQYVASVKKNVGGTGSQIAISPAGITVTNMAVRLLIRQAYGQQLQDFQLIGGPPWINSDRFDILVKPEGGGPMTPQLLQSLIRHMLEDRFALKVHTETRELPIFALMLARSDGRLGPNLTPASPECSSMIASRGRGPAPDGRGGPPPDGRGGPPPGRGGPDGPDGRGGPGRAGGPGPIDFDAPVGCGQRRGGFGRFRAGGTSMAQLASALSGNAQRVVIDKTGLTGYYDIALTYTPTPDQLPQGPPPPGAQPPPIDPDGPSLFTAIQEQLGLKLDSQRGPVEVVVIDSIQPPTEN
jgi:uncharacterized protein (TIGR03435 family)